MVNINREDRMSPTVATVGLLTITHARTTRNETREAKKREELLPHFIRVICIVKKEMGERETKKKKPAGKISLFISLSFYFFVGFWLITKKTYLLSVCETGTVTAEYRHKHGIYTMCVHVFVYFFFRYGLETHIT